MTRGVLFILILLFFQGALAQWNGWSDAASVRELLIKAQDEGMSYFSQFHIYDARSKDDVFSSKYKRSTGENLLVYGLDFYYASGTYFDTKYKTTNRKNIVSIVKKMWRENKAIPSFSWHLENPYVPTGFNSRMGCRYRMSKKLPGYPKEHRYVVREILNGTGERCGYGRLSSEDTSTADYAKPSEWFDARTREIADIVNEFVDESGKPIPFIFRLWHEMEDDWMWWGGNFVTPDEYKNFYISTKKKIMAYTPNAQILWAYCPDSYLDSEDLFMERYPGDEYVDIIGYDDYKIAKPEYTNREMMYARMVTRIAKEHGKVSALFVTSNSFRPTADNFFSKMLLPVLNDSLVNFGLVQMWSSGLFENDAQYEDRRFFLKQRNVLSVEGNI